METAYVLSSPAVWISIATVVIYSIYKYGTRNFSVFSDQGIPGPKPIPFVGNLWGMWKQNLPMVDLELSKKYGKVYGKFDGTQPNLCISDPDLIKSIFVKDFDHFVNRRDLHMKDLKVFRKMLGALQGQEWKDVRAAVTPTFTSGKIKRYSAKMKECAERLCQRLHSLASTQGKMGLKEELNNVTMDVIARCAFGIEFGGLGQKDDPFMQRAKRVFGGAMNTSPAILIPFIMPSFVVRWLSAGVFHNEDFRYFVDLMTNLIQQRSNASEEFYDFPESASETVSSYTKEEDGMVKPKWTKEEVDEIVAAQSTVFLLAGFDTTASTLACCCFNLAIHPEIQQQLFDDITAQIQKHGDISHEMIQELPYLDNFINEVFRMNPPALRLDRTCNKDVSYNGIHIKKGMLVSVPVFPLHYSEEYYSDPETFNPDRWSSENKANLNPYAFLPFGMGPRNCIAIRFAREELKLVLCTLIKQFRFFPLEETGNKMKVAEGFSLITNIVDTNIGLASRD